MSYRAVVLHIQGALQMPYIEDGYLAVGLHIQRLAYIYNGWPTYTTVGLHIQTLQMPYIYKIDTLWLAYIYKIRDRAIGLHIQDKRRYLAVAELVGLSVAEDVDHLQQ